MITGLAKKLVQNHLIDENAVAKAIEKARQEQIALVTYLVENNLIQDTDIARVASREFNIPLLDVRSLEIDSSVVQKVDQQLIKRYHALPLYQRGKRLFIGLSDPTNQRALEDIKFQTRLDTEPIVIFEKTLRAIIEEATDKPELGDDEDIELKTDDEPTTTPVEDINTGADDAPIVKFVNRMLLQAIRNGASDLHFEPYEKTYRVRFRQDGILQEIYRPPISMALRIAARIKVMAQLDIAERRVPQDGRIKLNVSRNRAIDFRVNTLPTLFGEKVVLRILDSSSAKLGIDMLGFDPNQKALLLNAISKPQGMVLVTGPTGSGKTVTLYTGLNILNTPEVNISTAEDPVEINMPGINQVNVNVKTGMTFANALRSFLRQDPDIIMVGEVRDLETAEIAIKAAQTGHLVLSTLHTNSAPETLTRLMNMGVAPFNIASSVTLIVAQRLARRLCSNCKTVREDIPQETLLQEGFKENELDDLVIYQPIGCELCNKGYKGRVGIYEVMPISDEIGRIIMANGNSLQIADQAKQEGINNLRKSGLLKVRAGVTSLEELNRVTKD